MIGATRHSGTTLLPGFDALRAFLLVALASCQVGPDFERPEYPVPTAFRSGGSDATADSTRVTLGDLDWSQAFTDPVLQGLVRCAVAGNYDARAAAERVLEARARVTVERADRYPDVEASLAAEGAAVPSGLALTLAWEIDFWGRVARATEAARAEVLASKFARHAVLQTLVADLAQAYFNLLELDAELEIARRIHDSRQHSYELVALRLEQGVVSRLELRQSESLLLRAARIIPDLEELIEQQENLVLLLTGANPGPVPRGRSLLAQEHVTDIPSGLPSQLLERRPDVRAAEQDLVAANARIGAAKALRYPAFRLTATGGLDSLGLAPSITQPIFNAGRLRSGQHVAESQQRRAILNYLQTLQRAVGEVADALIARQKRTEARLWSERMEEAMRDQARLSRARYRWDVTSYLEVLESERDHFEAELGLVRAIRDELIAYVQLYRALGGGWQDLG